MAQVVGYFEDYVQFKEGPFVAVEINGWRIECEVRGKKSPALPDLSVYELLETHPTWKNTKYGKFEEIAVFVDWLNKQVKEGKIVQRVNHWVAPQYERTM